MIMQTPTPTPTPPSAPNAPGRVIINGVDRTYDLQSGPSAVYEALQNQRDVLNEQVQNLENQRRELNSELQRGTVSGASKVGVENRILTIDKRIEDVEKQIAAVDAKIATQAAVPGAVVEHIQMNRPDEVPEEAFVLGGLFMIIVLLPLSIAMARRIWKRSTNAVAAIPSELMARLSRIEQAVDTSAVEIERIGEGQRFITKLFSENKVPVLPSNKDNA